MVKLIMTWNIKPGKEQEYFSYILHEYLPQLNQLGFDVTDAWVTAHGDHPQILLGAIMGSWTLAEQAIRNEKFHRINEELLDYVDDLDYKLAPNKGGFQF